MTRTLLATLALLLCWMACAQAKTSVSVDDIRFDTPRKQDFRAGEARLDRQPIRWESDIPWLISVESLAPDLGRSNYGGYAKALSDLQFRLANDRTWTEMREQAQEVTTGNPGKGSFMLDWRVLLDITKDRPGRYSAELRFTISEQ
jgi:hypothetical protein